MLKGIGKYEFRRILGKGASATVYLGVDTFSLEEVAVKVIDAAVFEDPDHGRLLRKQFLTEASLVGKLSHPHIVAILDAVIGEDAGYVAMEYVAGGDLSPHTAPGNLFPMQDAIQIGFKCCGALDYAYRQGIVHRDIKPENILVVRDTEVKIGDFGASYLQKSDSTQLSNVGTPYYFSPEQLSGGELSVHSDMFCLGVVLYELLTGHRPFDAPSMNALFYKIEHEGPVPPSVLRASLPRELDRILLTALRKDPDDRFPTWAEFALELADIGGLSVYEQSIPDSEKYETLRRVRMLGMLSEPEIWELVHASRWVRLPARSVIIREGEPGHTLYFLAKGQLKATKQGHLLDTVVEGECFGEMAYIRGGEMPREATVESLTDVIVAEFDSAALERMSPGCERQFMRALVRTLADRLSLADTRISRAARQADEAQEPRGEPGAPGETAAPGEPAPEA